MIQQVFYVCSAEAPTLRKCAKIVIWQQAEMYETQVLEWWDAQESVSTVYVGTDRALAEQHAVTEQQRLIEIGFTVFFPRLPIMSKTPTMFPLHLISPKLVMNRKLECFCRAGVDTELFQQLKKWRRTTALKTNIPPYYIATDKCLSMIALLTPHTIDQLGQIPGFSAARLKQYGSEILLYTTKHDQKYSFPLIWVDQKVSDEELYDYLVADQQAKASRRKEREQQLFAFKQRLLSCLQTQDDLSSIAKKLNIPIHQVIRKLRELAREGYDVLSYMQQQINQIAEQEKIKAVIQSLGANRLKPIFEQLYGTGEQLQKREVGAKYNEIRLICAFVELQSAS